MGDLRGFPYEEQELFEVMDVLASEFLIQRAVGRALETEDDVRRFCGLLADDLLWRYKLTRRPPGAARREMG